MGQTRTERERVGEVTRRGKEKQERNVRERASRVRDGEGDDVQTKRGVHPLLSDSADNWKKNIEDGLSASARSNIEGSAKRSYLPTSGAYLGMTERKRRGKRRSVIQTQRPATGVCCYSPLGS